MSDSESIPSGENQTATSGGTDQNSEQKTDTVKYSTYQKVLGEKKRNDDRIAQMQSELSAFKDAQKQQEQDDLFKRGEFEKLAKQKDEEISNLRNGLSEHKTRETNYRKMSSFLKTLGGNLDAKFYDLVPIDNIVANPDTGEIDDMSVTKAVEQYRQTFPETIITASSGMPNKSPNSSVGSTLSYDEWVNLPLKEKKARMAEAFEARKQQN